MFFSGIWCGRGKSTKLRKWETESIATLPPSIQSHRGTIWFDQISSQWESQKKWFAFISFGKIQFFLPAFETSRSCQTASDVKFSAICELQMILQGRNCRECFSTDKTGKGFVSSRKCTVFMNYRGIFQTQKGIPVHYQLKFLIIIQTFRTTKCPLIESN